jgi:hypothetical protein
LNSNSTDLTLSNILNLLIWSNGWNSPALNKWRSQDYKRAWAKF